MRVLVAGWIGSTNLGDELVFAALRAKLAARGADVTAISVDPAATAAAHGVDAVRGHPPAVLAAAGRADAVVLGGGGLLQDETSPLNLPYHLSRVWAARARRTPFAAVGVGVGRLDTAAGRGLVRAALRGPGLRGVSVRDEASAALLDRVGVPGAVVATDLAFALPAPDVEAEAGGVRGGSGPPEDCVVVCLRPWTGRRGVLPARSRTTAIPAAFAEAVAAALDRVADASGWKVRFVAFQADRDDAVHRQVAARMRTPAEWIAPGLDDVLVEVARGQVVVAMRYHAVVAATLAARPTVAIGYSPKVDALAGELGGGGRLLPFDAGALAGLPDAVSAAAGRSAAVADARDRLQQRERGNDAVLDRLMDAG